MPRQARQNSQTGIYHIILRGINKQVIFNDNEDRKKFLGCLQVYRDSCQCLIYGYCLMDNHIHLLLKEGQDPIAGFIKKVGVSYVAWYNRKYQRCGHLFQDRFKSEVIEDEPYLLTALRYIHQNPVQAGIVARCEEYAWSSYAEYTGSSAVTETAFILGIFDQDYEKAVQYLQTYMDEQAAAACIEMNDFAKPTDAQARILIQECIGSASLAALPSMDKQKRNSLLYKIKQLNGVSTWQIARITGLSQSIVARA
ncbi:transposase [Sporomusa termitida]|uniref:Transposase IS200 like protein n=1 Tax=Sporomusa termitida TaxID=2377 RepID=A0A517DY86_9FIRM|nr:transposase [Sporomusa termitida]QDR82308.1 Transposase IS200 like protein [Sporomusa termitida]